VADLVEMLYQLMAEHVRASHVVATDDTIMPMLSKGKAANARMWVYVGDHAHPYNVFDFTLHRGRDGPKYFLKDYRQVLLADAYGGYNGVVAGNEITRAGCWAHLRRKVIEAEKTAPEIARETVEMVRALYAVEKQARDASVVEGLELRHSHSAPVLAELRKSFSPVAAQASHGRSGQLRPRSVGRVEYILFGWRSANRQQCQRTEDETRGAQSQEFAVRRQPARRSDGSDPGQPSQHLAAPRHRPATLSAPVVDEPADNAHERTIYLAAQSMEATSGRKNG
jgi:hypothetical protein